MTRYTVQFELPCVEPVHNVRMKRRKWGIEFFVPLNHPLIDKMGFQELIESARQADLMVLSTHLNKT